MAYCYKRVSYLSIQEIAEACGYTSYTYPGNVFKKETGISPGRYRKEAMDGNIEKKQW